MRIFLKYYWREKIEDNETDGAISMLREIQMYTNYHLPHLGVDERKTLKYIATCFSD
jgi:hypothetical protein